MKPTPTTKAKVRRFNTRVLERRTTNEEPLERFALNYFELTTNETREKADSLKRQASNLALWNSCLSVLVIAAAFIENECAYYEELSPLQIAAIRAVIGAASLVQIFLTLQGAQRQLDLLKVLGQKHPDSKLQTASLLYDSSQSLWLFCEVLHLFIVMPPFADFERQYACKGTDVCTFSVDDLVTCVIVFRLYHVFRFVYSRSPYLLPKAQFHACELRRRLHGLYNSPKFIINAQLNVRPFRTLLVMGLAVMMVSGIMFHIIERRSHVDLLVYDGPWFMSVTQMTVGYGDIYPYTDIGKLIAMGPGLFAVFTWSMVVTFALKQFEMKLSEKQLAQHLYNRHSHRKDDMGLAATLLQKWWRLKLARRCPIDAQRLRLLFSLKFSRDQFRKKLVKDMVRQSPQLVDQLCKFDKHVRLGLKGMKTFMKELPALKQQAGTFSTKAFDMIAKVLLSKHTYQRLRFFGRTPGTMRSSMLTTKRRTNKRSSIGNKKASDFAVRKMRERRSLAQHSQQWDSGHPSISSLPSRDDSQRRISCGACICSLSSLQGEGDGQ